MSTISPFHRSIFSRLPSFKPLSPTSILPKFQFRTFSQSVTMCKRKRKGPAVDPKIQMIDYHLWHPLTPRPLKLSYMRNLRHRTIMQAWLLYKHKLKRERELELERQYNKIHEACEELKRVDEKLFRVATDRKGIGYFPLEFRLPTDTPPRGGFNEDWKRPVEKVGKGAKR